MTLAPANVPLSFEVTFDDPSLNVAMSVYDDSGLSPALVSGPAAMANVVGNTYRGKFTADPGISYIIFKAVYTDNTFVTLHPDYAAGSESIRAEIIAGTPVLKTDIIGFVEQDDDIVMEVEDNDQIIGFVEE